MPRALPGPHNVYIPGARQGKLIVDFSRNISDFAVNRYCQIVPTEQTVGIYYQMGLDERARITDTDLAKYRWEDGMDRPDANDAAEYFEEKQFRCQRDSYSDRVGKMTSEQAAWNEMERRERSLAQKAMTARTCAVIASMTNAANYPASHVADLSGTPIPGVTGNWAASTSTTLNIKRTLNHIKKRITLDTRAALNSDDLLLVMSPETAEMLSVTQEIVELVKENIGGMKFLRADNDLFPKETYGLPPRLYGHEVLIEKTVRVTSPRGLLAQTAVFALPLGTVIVCHRPNSLEGVEGGRSFSTCSLYVYRDDDMKVETDSDTWNRVTKLAVTDNFTVGMTAPISGFLLQNVA